MVAWLDFLVTWIKRLLGFLPEPLVEALWLPVLVVLLVVGLRVLLRHGLPVLSRAAHRLTELLVALLAAPLMAALVVVATPFRWLRLRPPSVVLGIDDAIVTTANVVTQGAQRGVKTVTSLSTRSKLQMLLILPVCVVVLWRWNDGHCPEGAEEFGCVRPVAEWANHVGLIDQPVPVEIPPTPDPSLVPDPSVAPVP
jgi:hypothetical protein